MFLFTDSQIVDERMLVFINDLLASGEIPDLFPQVCICLYDLILILIRLFCDA